jgi:hypothetical protein
MKEFETFCLSFLFTNFGVSCMTEKIIRDSVQTQLKCTLQREQKSATKLHQDDKKNMSVAFTSMVYE